MKHFPSLAFRATTSLTLSVMFFALAIGLWAYQEDKFGISADVTVTQNRVSTNFDELVMPGDKFGLAFQDQYQAYGVKFSSGTEALSNGGTYIIPTLVTSGAKFDSYVNSGAASVSSLTRARLLQQFQGSVFTTYPNALIGGSGTSASGLNMGPSSPIVITFHDPNNPTQSSTTDYVKFNLGVAESPSIGVGLTVPGTVTSLPVGVNFLDKDGNILGVRTASGSGSNTIEFSGAGIAKVRIFSEPTNGQGTFATFPSWFGIDNLSFDLPGTTDGGTTDPDDISVLRVTPQTGVAPLAVIATYTTPPAAGSDTFKIGSFSSVCASGQPQNVLDWGPIPVGGSETYAVYRRKSHVETNFSVVAGAQQLGAGTSTYTDTGVSASVEYDYRVDRVISGQTTSSQEVRFTTTPCTASDFQITNVTAGASSGSTTLTWTALPAGATYSVWRTPVGRVEFSELNSAPIPASTTTFTDTTGQAGTRYQYHVSSRSATVNYNTQSVSMIAGQASSALLHQFNWNFSDGTVVESNNISEMHTYLTAGTYDVVLKQWGTEVGRQTVTVTSSTIQTQTATFGTNKPVYQPGESVDFTLKNTGSLDITCPNAAPYIIQDQNGAIVLTPVGATVIDTLTPTSQKTWTWNQKNNDGVQVADGAYSVIVTCGSIRKSANFTISSTTPQTLDFTVTPTSGVAPLLVTGRFTGSNTPLTWDFGDGTTYTNAPATQEHTYQNAGVYTVTLRSGTAIGTKQVTVTASVNPQNPSGPTIKPNTSGTSKTGGTQLVATGGSLVFNLAIAGILSAVVTYMLLLRRKEPHQLEQS